MAKKKPSKFSFHNPNVYYPVLVCILEPGDERFDEGRTHMIEQSDGDRHYFKSEEAMRGFMKSHAFSGIPSAQMEEIRKQLKS